MKNFIDRFDEYMSYAGLNDNKVTVQAGITVGLIGSARKRGKSVSVENIGKILYTYKDLNARWLLTGEGEMISSEITEFPNNESLTFHFKEENKELRAKNESLNREIGRLEGQIIELKKRVPEEEPVICAAASGSDLRV